MDGSHVGILMDVILLGRVCSVWCRSKYHIDGLMQGCGNSSAWALELPQACAKPLIYVKYNTCDLDQHSNHHNKGWRPLMDGFHVGILMDVILLGRVGSVWCRNKYHIDGLVQGCGNSSAHTPVHEHWSYRRLALSHWYMLGIIPLI